MKLFIVLAVCIFNVCTASSRCPKINANVWTGRNAAFDDETLQRILSASNTGDFQQILDPLLQVRRVGNAKHDKVRNYIVDSMKALGWQTQLQSFTDSTPFGRKRFSNIISTQYPSAVKRFVFACHYDTKWEPKGFVGAIDSAVPCAMMIDLAKSLNDTLWNSRARFEETDYSLQFLFFDGEEAFRDWKETDSLYGSRYMAKKLAEDSFELPPDSVTAEQYAGCNANDVATSQIDRIAIFVLLDLIGTRDTQFLNGFRATQSIYSELAQIEADLLDLDLLSPRETPLFKTSTSFLDGLAEDDHIPFLRKNVPILHLISTPFPSVWHTLDDNRDNLDWPTIDDLNRILRVFLSSYFALA